MLTTKTGRQVRCKVCNHPHRAEIEVMRIVQNMSSRTIEEEAAKKGWGKLSFMSVERHFNNHVDETRKLNVIYAAEQKQIKIIREQDTISMLNKDDELTIKLRELKRLDKSIQETCQILKFVSAALKEELNTKIKYKNSRSKQLYNQYPVQQALVTLYKAASEELRQSVKVKMELLGVDATSKIKEMQVTLVDMLLGAKSE